MPSSSASRNPRSQPAALDDPNKIVKVIASDGKSGDTRELQYANCKVIGNGSFGVVFQARLLGVTKDLEDIAIKKVLQDKRFKVRLTLSAFSV
jgi:glycogen synthase kinase 3 beta